MTHGRARTVPPGAEDADPRHVLVVADAASPIARGWLEAVGNTPSFSPEVVSTAPTDPDDVPAPYTREVPVAFNDLRGGSSGGDDGGSSWLQAVADRLDGLAFQVRHWTSPITVHRAASEARQAVEAADPDLVHALRLPYEGFLAHRAAGDRPLVGSIWGNDITLYAKNFPWHARLTRRFLRRADGLVCDCHRDLRLAREWGFPADHPATVLPGGGGVDVDAVQPGPRDRALFEDLGLDPDAPIVFNPRGIRHYAPLEPWFRAAAAVREEVPGVQFAATGMRGHPEAEHLLADLDLGGDAHLLPHVDRDEFLGLLQGATVVTSLTTHDGTPNSLLEAMAAGAFPVVGDVESVREWIGHGENGLVCDATDPDDVARALLRALRDDETREAGGARNRRLVAELANRDRVRDRIEAFYDDVLDHTDRA